MNDPEPFAAVANPPPPLKGRPERTVVRRKRRSLLTVGAICALVILFGRPLAALCLKAVTSEFHSYILLVPFIFAYLLFSRKNELPREYARAWPQTLLFFSVGLGATLIAILAGETLRMSEATWLSLMILSFVSFAVGTAFLLLGKSWVGTAAFPLFFLIFLVPMPDMVINTLETASQHGSAWAADLFFRLGDTPYIHDGMVFQLPNINIRVAQECSGIRSSWILFITSILAANTFLRTNWKRALLVFAVIPLGIIRNGFRVWVIGLLCVHFGPQMINSPIHRRGGPLFFALSLIPLFGLIAWLRHGETTQNKVSAERPLVAA